MKYLRLHLHYEDAMLVESTIEDENGQTLGRWPVSFAAVEADGNSLAMVTTKVILDHARITHARGPSGPEIER